MGNTLATPRGTGMLEGPRVCRLIIAFAVLVASVRGAPGQEPGDATALAGLLPAGASPRVLVFTLDEIKPPAGGHVQGIAVRHDAERQRHLAFLSHDSLLFGYLLVVEFPDDLSRPGRAIHLHKFPSDGTSPPLRHAGGIQLSENVLGVGVEDNQEKTRSQIQFWDATEAVAPRQLDHLTIHRAGQPEAQTAGGVGLARHGDRHVVAVANWDARDIDFYLSNGKPLADPQCRFALHKRWQAATANRLDWRPDQKTDAYQAVNLVANDAGGLSLLGFATDTMGRDIVDVFQVDLDQRDADHMLHKVARQTYRLTAGCHFRYAGGWWRDENGPVVLSSERKLSPQTKLNVAR